MYEPLAVYYGGAGDAMSGQLLDSISNGAASVKSDHIRPQHRVELADATGRKEIVQRMSCCDA